MSREKPEENVKRFPALFTPKQFEMIEDYQAEFRPPLPKAEAIRNLVELGLEAHRKKKAGGRED